MDGLKILSLMILKHIYLEDLVTLFITLVAWVACVSILLILYVFSAVDRR